MAGYPGQAPYITFLFFPAGDADRHVPGLNPVCVRDFAYGEIATGQDRHLRRNRLSRMQAPMMF